MWKEEDLVKADIEYDRRIEPMADREMEKQKAKDSHSSDPED